MKKNTKQSISVQVITNWELWLAHFIRHSNEISFESCRRECSHCLPVFKCILLLPTKQNVICYLTLVWSSTLAKCNTSNRIYLYFPNIAITSWMSQYTSIVTHLFKLYDQKMYNLWKMRSTYSTSALITRYNRLYCQ